MVSRSKDAEKVAPVAWVEHTRQAARKTSPHRIFEGIRPAIPLVCNHKDNIPVPIFLPGAVPIRKCQLATRPKLVKYASIPRSLVLYWIR